MTILLVEQNVRMALTISDQAYIMETGQVVLEGEAKGLLDNELVRRAYLGKG
jgi:branched-chain amino acid transport system ATP-binding protein